MKKKILLFIMMLTASVCVLSSCSKDDDDFDYPMEKLYGKWKAVEVQANNKWYDVTTYPYTKFGMSITFYEDGTYYGAGYFGYGNGTYTVKGDKIYTFIQGEAYATYTVNSLTSNKADLTMTMGGDSLRMKAVKEY